MQDALPRANRIPRHNSDRIGFAGKCGAIKQPRPLRHTIHRRARTNTEGNLIARHNVSDGDSAPIITINQSRARDFQRGQFRRGGSCSGAGAMIQIASRQQKERQRQRRIEPRISAEGIDRFMQRRGTGQQDRKRDGNVHIHPPRADCPRSGCKKRHGGIGQRRESDGCGNPMKHGLGCLRRARPDRNRQNHDVHHRKACDGDTGQ